jgi:hypothetical protein
MSGLNIANLINLLGYTIGIALYAMLLFMVLKHPTQSTTTGEPSHTTFYADWSSSSLLLITAMLGLLWNIGALAIYGLKRHRLHQQLSNRFRNFIHSSRILTSRRCPFCPARP